MHPVAEMKLDQVFKIFRREKADDCASVEEKNELLALNESVESVTEETTIDKISSEENMTDEISTEENIADEISNEGNSADEISTKGNVADEISTKGNVADEISENKNTPREIAIETDTHIPERDTAFEDVVADETRPENITENDENSKIDEIENEISVAKDDVQNVSTSAARSVIDTSIEALRKTIRDRRRCRNKNASIINKFHVEIDPTQNQTAEEELKKEISKSMFSEVREIDRS